VVKTTCFGKETPFFITRSEVELSRTEAGLFHLYRLFEFGGNPGYFHFAAELIGIAGLIRLPFRLAFLNPHSIKSLSDPIIGSYLAIRST
jgi:hypothetical protein